MERARTSDYFNGLREGIRRFAWWKDGQQWVGTTGTSLKKAIEQVDKEETSFINDALRSGAGEVRGP